VHADTPAGVHTASLSLAVNVGHASRMRAPLHNALAADDWAALADGIERLAPRTTPKSSAKNENTPNWEAIAAPRRWRSASAAKSFGVAA
jgi:hypothetical protein